MTRPKFKTDRTVVARLFHPKVLDEARKALKAIDSKSPYPPPKKKSRNMGKG
jgi:hypothetical protein